MLWRVTGIEHHDAEEDDHVGQAVERGVEKTSKLCDVTGLPGDVAIQHVEEIGDDQHDPCPEKFSDAKEHAASDVDRDADRGEDIRMDTGSCKSADHRIDDPHCTASDTCSYHWSFLVSSF